jgi:hypothetical protein
MFAERGVWCASLIALLSLIGGCSVTRPPVGEVALVASPRPVEPDIPLPVGFVLVDQSSEDWSSGPLRYVRHRYRGRGDRHAVRSFYREQMPLVRWTPIEESSLHGQCRMSFARGSESCSIAIERAGSGRSRDVIVDVLITPKVR